MSDRDEKCEFCQEYINGLSQDGRDDVFDIVRLTVNDNLIDSSNSDGSRIYWHNISDTALEKIYTAILSWLEN